MNRILVVEDERDILTVVTKMLQKNGFDAVSARSGQEAIGILASGEKFDMVLLDMKMPVMHGLECLRELRKIDSTISAIFLTGSLNRGTHAAEIEELGLTNEDIL